jgi:endonuclease-3
VATAKRVVEDFGGEVPRSMEDLTSLPGVGRKTANVVQGHLWGKSDGVAADTHVMRVSYRLALTTEQEPVKVERDLNHVFAPEDYPDVNFHFIAHGRATCHARSPKCGECVVNDICPKKGVARPKKT